MNDNKVADRNPGNITLRTSRVHTPQALEKGREVVLENSAAHYLCRVLRVTPGQAVTLFNGDGFDYPAEVRRTGRREVVLRVEGRQPGLPESRLRITVAQALCRGERMDQTLQKCTELGAAAFQPLVTERAEVRLHGERLQRRLDHWRGVVVSACEQCGRARVPEVRAPLTLPEWLDQEPRGLRLVLDPAAESPLSGARVGDQVALAVGPEGGFSDAELGLLRERDVKAFRLGPRILRTETAAPAAVAILQTLAGDLG